MFAAFLKLLMPLVVVLPGICAVMLLPPLQDNEFDSAYPKMMELLPSGLLGLTFAALVAAIVSSLASMTNSVSTIFTMDIYKQFAVQDVTDRKLVIVGRNVALISVVVAVLCAQPLLGSLESAFQYIQNFTGFFTPGILVIFLVALFWKKATSLSVLVAAISSLILSLGMFLLAPDDFPFQHRMGIVFFVTGLLCYLTALIQGYEDHEKAIVLSDINFKTSVGFNISTIIVFTVLTIIYSIWW
jgi:SSS family solute:Na+ symporter